MAGEIAPEPQGDFPRNPQTMVLIDTNVLPRRLDCLRQDGDIRGPAGPDQLLVEGGKRHTAAQRELEISRVVDGQPISDRNLAHAVEYHREAGPGEWRQANALRAVGLRNAVPAM